MHCCLALSLCPSGTRRSFMPLFHLATLIDFVPTTIGTNFTVHFFDRRQALDRRQATTIAASQMMKLAQHRAAPSTGGVRRERQVGFAQRAAALDGVVCCRQAVAIRDAHQVLIRGLDRASDGVKADRPGWLHRDLHIGAASPLRTGLRGLLPGQARRGAESATSLTSGQRARRLRRRQAGGGSPAYQRSACGSTHNTEPTHPHAGAAHWPPPAQVPELQPCTSCVAHTHGQPASTRPAEPARCLGSRAPRVGSENADEDATVSGDDNTLRF